MDPQFDELKQQQEVELKETSAEARLSAELGSAPLSEGAPRRSPGAAYLKLGLQLVLWSSVLIIATKTFLVFCPWFLFFGLLVGVPAALVLFIGAFYVVSSIYMNYAEPPPPARTTALVAAVPILLLIFSFMYTPSTYLQFKIYEWVILVGAIGLDLIGVRYLLKAKRLGDWGTDVLIFILPLALFVVWNANFWRLIFL